MVIFFIKSSYRPEHTLGTGLKQIDWIGSILFVGSLTSFLIPLSWVSVVHMLVFHSFLSILFKGRNKLLLVELAYASASDSRLGRLTILGCVLAFPDQGSIDTTQYIKQQDGFHQLYRQFDPRHGCMLILINNLHGPADKYSQQFGTLFYLPLYYQAVKSYSPIVSGLALVSHTSIVLLRKITNLYKSCLNVPW